MLILSSIFISKYRLERYVLCEQGLWFMKLEALFLNFQYMPTLQNDGQNKEIQIKF